MIVPQVILLGLGLIDNRPKPGNSVGARATGGGVGVAGKEERSVRVGSRG